MTEYQQRYTDSLEVVDREEYYGDGEAIKIAYPFDDAGQTAIRSFWLTDDGARDFIDELETWIEDTPADGAHDTGDPDARRGLRDEFDDAVVNIREMHGYHQIYTDAIDVVGRELRGNTDVAASVIKIECRCDAGGRNATEHFWMTDSGARDFVNELESHIDDSTARVSQ